MNVFLKNNKEPSMFILFLPVINRLYKIMAGTLRDEVFIEYAYDLLRAQYLSLGWRDKEGAKRSFHRRMLFPLSVRWNFDMARNEAMDLLRKSFSKGKMLDPGTHRLIELAESAFCAAIIRNVRYFYFFHGTLLNVTDDLRNKNYLYDEVIRSLACTNDKGAIASLVDALFDGLEPESNQWYRIITPMRYINILGENVLSMDSMLGHLLDDKSAASKLYEADLLRHYLTAMTNFCYSLHCLNEISQLQSNGKVLVTEIQEIYAEYSDMVFRRTSHVESKIDHITVQMAAIAL